MIFENVGFFFLEKKKSSCPLKKYAEIGKLSYVQIFLKSSMPDVVQECIWYLFFSTNIHHCVNNSHDIKVLMKVIKTETFNIDFTSQ